jgi:hypothetical protein
MGSASRLALRVTVCEKSYIGETTAKMNCPHKIFSRKNSDARIGVVLLGVSSTLLANDRLWPSHVGVQ